MNFFSNMKMGKRLLAVLNERIAAASSDNLKATEYAFAGKNAEATSGVREANQRVSETALVAQTVERDITSVKAAADKLAGNAGEVTTSSNQLLAMASDLGDTVGKFKT
jgi:methyl-accepting chemotaxis protein